MSVVKPFVFSLVPANIAADDWHTEAHQSAICAARHKRISRISPQEDTKTRSYRLPRRGTGEKTGNRFYVASFVDLLGRALYHRAPESVTLLLRHAVKVSPSRLKSAICDGRGIKRAARGCGGCLRPGNSTGIREKVRLLK